MNHHMRLSRVFMGVCAFGVFLLSACNSTPVITDDSVTVVDQIELKELLNEEPETMLIDVRQDYRYRLSHLPGAINIPLPDLMFTDPRFAEAVHVVVYGDGHRNSLSHAAAKKLLAGGLFPVSDFRGGIEMWERADGPTVTGPKPHGGS